MAVFTGKSQFPNGGNNDTAIFNRYYMQTGTVGNAWMAFSGATGAGSGISPPDAFTTLILAQTAAVADNGDVVYVLPGHAETVVGAAGMTFNKAGVTYQGVGTIYGRPTITFSTSTAAQIIVSGARIKFDNITFDFTGIDAIVAAISVTGADVQFSNCEFICNSATIGVVKGILTAATAARFRVISCRFIGTAANSGTTTTAQLDHEVGVDYWFVDNFFCGKMTQAILNATTILRGLIDSNYFVIATGTVAITMAAASTPFIVNNRFNMSGGTTPIVAAAGFVSGNAYSAAAGVTAGTAQTF